VNPLGFELEIEESLKKKIAKYAAKNPEFRKAVEGKIKQILENPARFKPLHAPMQSKRRAHILKSFVLVYEFFESEKIVRIVDVDHHDNIYK